MKEDSSTPEITRESLVRKRSERIDQFTRESLADDVPLRAAIGAACGDLFEMGLWFQEAIYETVSTSDDRRASLEEISGLVDMRLKIDRQIDRYVHVYSQEAAARRTDNRPRPK